MVALLPALALTAACSRVDNRQLAQDLESAASKTPEWTERSALGRRLWQVAATFYEERHYQPAWTTDGRPTRRLDELLQVLGEADTHGLDPAGYGLPALIAARSRAEEAWIGAQFDVAAIPELELRLTYAFLQHAADLLAWRSSPRRIAANWLDAPRKADLAAALRTAVADGSVRKVLDDFAPAHPQYNGLRAALGRALKGSSDAAAVEKIEMNLERWRWLPRDLGDRYILINVPSYQMQVIEGDKPVLAMRVIVGAPDSPTPLFSDRMTYIVFSPFWNIPESILRDETLLRVSEDPEYLERNNIEVVGTSGEVIDPEAVDWENPEAIEGIRLRQAPGPDNALGSVKFIFPNHFSVYLHDTPTESLFRKEKRAFSHGCIRIEKPVALAEYVLRGRPQWTGARIAAAMQSRAERAVTLDEPLPVHIGYWTAWVEEDGSVTFFDDVYGLDRRHGAVRDRD